MTVVGSGCLFMYVNDGNVGGGVWECYLHQTLTGCWCVQGVMMLVRWSMLVRRR